MRLFLAFLLILALFAETAAGDYEFMRRKETIRKSGPAAKPAPGQDSRPHTSSVSPPCALKLAEGIEMEKGRWIIRSEDGEKIPLAGIETPDMDKAKIYLEANVVGAWLKICHPALMPLRGDYRGIIYIEPRLRSVQEEMVERKLARIRK